MPRVRSDNLREVPREIAEAVMYWYLLNRNKYQWPK